MANHAVLSASSAALWIACPGSQHMRALFPETSSDAAKEGTLAHELAALEIEYEAGGLDKTRYEKKRAEILKRIDQFYAEHPEVKGSAEIMDKTLRPYIDYVSAAYTEALDEDEGASIATEQRVHFDAYVPYGFGTSDVIIAAGNEITVIDLKYGKGVPVSAVNNPQIRLYALGAVDLFSTIFDLDTAKLVIYQPRLDSVTEEEISIEDLKAWADTVVAPKAFEALSADPSYHPGDWCQNKFCPGAAVCKERAEYLLDLDRLSGKDPAVLSRKEIGEALTKTGQLKKWAKSLESFSLEELSAGREIPGWKIVEGRSNRAFSDEDKAAAAAIAAGYDRSLLFEKKMITLSAMEELMGKKDFKRIEGDLVVKPAGKPTLAPESDKRPAYSVKPVDNNDFDE